MRKIDEHVPLLLRSVEVHNGLIKVMSEEGVSSEDTLLIKMFFQTPDTDENDLECLTFALNPKSGRHFAQEVRSGILMKLRELNL